MIELMTFVAGMLVGGAVAWLLAVNRARAAAARETAELQNRLGADESTITELRGQVSGRDDSIAHLRRELQNEQQARVAADTRLNESLKSIAEQRKLLEDAQTKLKDAFKALSLDALRSNSEQFARQTAEKVRPLVEALVRYEQEIKQIEAARQTAYGSLNEQLTSIATTHRELSRRTTTLATALRAPQVKGRWGEITLRRAVEVAGLSPHCDFVEQATVDAADARLRPDLVVKLPGNRTIVVDAKAPTSAYLDAIEADNEQTRSERLAEHAGAIRQHMRGLSAKDYASSYRESTDFVVLFVPGESFFSAALEQNRELIEEGIRRNVILASPTTLIALLRAVAYSWQQQDLVENARMIGETATELYERICKYAEHFGKVGDGLRRATEAYNDAVGSWEHRVVPAGRRIEELGVKARNEDAFDLRAIDATPRALPESVVNGTSDLADAADGNRPGYRPDAGAAPETQET